MDEDTFLTTVYVTADDYCKAQAVDWPVAPGPVPALSVSEVLTVSLVSRWARFSSDRDFYRYATRHWRAAFPNLPDRSHFNRLLRAVVPALIGFSFPLPDMLKYKTLITQEMLKKGFLAVTSVFTCIDHTKSVVDQYFGALDGTFALIRQCESGRAVDELLEGPVCHAGFTRLN